MNKRTTVGIQANKAEKLGDTEDGQRWRVFPNEQMAALPGLKVGTVIHRNRDHQWEAALHKKSSDRHVGLQLTLAETSGGLRLSIIDEDGIVSTTDAAIALQPAQNAEQAESGLRASLAKLGNTMFVADHVELKLSQPWFVPSSAINALRRDAVAAHEAARLAAWQRPQRKAPAEPRAVYPDTQLSYLANVYNEKAREFYHKHGVQLIAAAYEAHEEAGEVPLMITKHTYTLRFDCKPCEMHVVGAIKPGILNSPPPSAVPYSPLVFHRKRPN
jgi:putative protease